MVNKVFLIGRLGQDPELNFTDSGTAVCNISIATDESYTNNSGERVEQTEWHDIVVWGKQAESVDKYLSKGRQVHVEGSLQTRSWEDRDGNSRYSTEVKAQRVQFLGGSNDSVSDRPNDDRPSSGFSNGTGGSSNSQSGSGFSKQEAEQKQAFEPDDDLPF